MSLPDDGVDGVRGPEPEPPLQDHLARAGQKNNSRGVHYRQSREHRQNDEPEPQENIDLLVEDVES